MDDRMKYEFVPISNDTTEQPTTSITDQTTAAGPHNTHQDALKAVLLLSLLLLCFFCSILPFLLKRLATRSSPETRRQKYALVFTLLSVFGGGVFLATCLLDLLPDAVKDVNDALMQMNATSPPKDYSLLFTLKEFPISEFAVGLGFFVVLFSEQFVMWMKERGCFSAPDDSTLPSEYAEEQTTPSTTTQDRVPAELVVGRNGNGGRRRRSTQKSEVSRRDRSRSAPAPRSQRGNIPAQLPTLTTRDAAFFTASDNHREYRRQSDSDSASSFEAANDAVPIDPVTEISVISNSPIPATVNHEHGHDEHDGGAGHDHDLHFDPGSHSTVRALLLVGALSLHSIFEGLALGLAESNEDALALFTALSIHKSLISFSVGLRLVQSALSTMAIFLCCLTFCIGAPIGGTAGIILEEAFTGATGLMISGCLTGVACGTFLYITCFEILPHELNDGKHRLAKMITLLFGYALIVVLVVELPG